MLNIPADVQKQLDKYLKAADILKKELKEATDPLIIQDIVNDLEKVAREYRKLRGQYDVLYFAYEYFSDCRNPTNENNLIPLGVTYETAPAFHQYLCSKLDELNSKPTKKIGWSVPRGHGKSAYLSNIFPVHQTVYKKRNYIIIVSETEKMAQKFVEWIADQLKFNQKLREDFSELLSPQKQRNDMDNLEGFVAYNGCKIQAASIGKQLRGARHGAYRPDLVILDDLESSKNTNTKELRDKNFHWFNSVIMPIGDITKTSYIYMGTLVHGQGLLPAVLSRSDFDSKIYSAIVSEPIHTDGWEHIEQILRNTENPNREIEADNYYIEHKEYLDDGAATLWQERFTYYDLIKIKVNVGSKAFASEYLNKPSDEESCIFKRDYFTFYDEQKLEYRKLTIYGFWDLAVGKSSRSDYNAAIFIGRDDITGTMYILECWAEKIPLHKAKQKVKQLIKKWHPKVFGVETVQMQYEIYRQLKEELYKDGIYYTRLLPVLPKGKKEDRIEQLEPIVESGYLRFNKSHRILLEQMELFPSCDHDDTVDALASAVEIAGKQRKRTYYKKPAGY